MEVERQSQQDKASVPADSQLERKSQAEGNPSVGEDEPPMAQDPSINRGQGKSFKTSHTYQAKRSPCALRRML